uniref:Proline rich 35 n=1 Tax=Laticauda laticaudata TaxID=8630 RepID=A0A8C5RX64_LATLA
MSKDEAGCKLAPVYKHKERKPKKPHYIPRPWGKPYNYKCFQCPFTCMEKSHLYNHMKYSLCKNSLSLLIESDWPYKKGGLLHPELRLLQATETSRIHGRQEEPETYDTMVMEATHSKCEEVPSVELDPKPKHCKMPSKCSGSGGVFMEQWKLVANGQRRSATGVLSPCTDGNVIPCYPPPAYGDFHESQGLNFSLLGINYPLAPNLFSYFSPSVTSGATSQSHLAQFPFLASTAQLMHPHSAHFQPLQNPERSTFLPRFYYPLLFEHSFTSAETIPAPLQPQTPMDPSKGGALKVPVLKTGLPWAKGFHEEPLPEQSHKRLLLQEEEKKWLIHERESYSLLAAGHLCRKSSPEKTGSSEMNIASDQPFLKPSNDQVITVGPRDQEMTTMLIGDLSKTLEEYQEVEKKLSHLAKEDTPAQKQLRDQLVKIRQELFHIHQALEKANKFNEGPLDLSVKRSSKNLVKGHQDKKESKIGVHGEKVHSKDMGSTNKGLEVGEADLEKLSNCFLETQNKTIDLLIKMSHSKNIQNSPSETHLGAVIKAEVLPLNVPLEFRHVMEPYYNHTTKCEADSSVLLSTDGRSSGNQAPPPLSVTEETPLGCRAIPCSLSCNLTSETSEV